MFGLQTAGLTMAMFLPDATFFDQRHISSLVKKRFSRPTQIVSDSMEHAMLSGGRSENGTAAAV